MSGSAPLAIMISSRKFVGICGLIAVGLFFYGLQHPLPLWLLAGEIFATILGLFLFTSFRIQLNKNALTYGMAMVTVSTFFSIWWPRGMNTRFERDGFSALTDVLQRNFFTWHGLDEIIHADTMLFILGLTFFVAIIAQTRLLESITFYLLKKNRGRILPTVLAITAGVAVASGVLDGVSMIGLTIRTLVIILLLASAPTASIRYAVMVSTVVTTVCGMYLAYGEPPNLIMKANLVSADGQTILNDAYFLRYCLPCAVASFLVIAWNLRKRLGSIQIDMSALDVLDSRASTVRFLQASRHGEVPTPTELIEDHAHELDGRAEQILESIGHGSALGIALVKAEVPAPVRQRLLGKFISEDLAESLDRHYLFAAMGKKAEALQAEAPIDEVIEKLSHQQARAQGFGIAGILVFITLLFTHAVNHHVPLCIASFAGFGVALLGIIKIPKMRTLALHEARVEYAEYYFLFPLFLGISLLTHSGFFDALKHLVDQGIQQAGAAPMALAQFSGCTVLSAILDNNVVADFGSRALLHLDVGLIHLFALAQIAGYAIGGCWTHIGSAQSVVAYSFIKRDIDAHYTPLQWIKEMTPVLLQISVLLGLIILMEALLLS
jgi:hypothetical protein